MSGSSDGWSSSCPCAASGAVVVAEDDDDDVAADADDGAASAHAAGAGDVAATAAGAAVAPRPRTAHEQTPSLRSSSPADYMRLYRLDVLGIYSLLFFVMCVL